MPNSNTPPAGKQFVLFSPIGLTDPVREHRDGPLLQILRHYPPQVAVLFLTKETLETHRSDDRFRRLARHVCPNVELRVSEHGEIADAHLFEIFDEPFRNELMALHEEFPDAELVVNLSSGTPQMEASLYLMTATLPFEIIPIQVATPAKASNSRTEKKTPFIVEEQIRDLLDTDKTENRCKKVEYRNAMAAITRQNVKALVEGYDYAAALKIVRPAQALFDMRLMKVLQAGCSRMMLDIRQAQDSLLKLGGPFAACFEVSGDYAMLYEGILNLKVLLERRAYADYARALSPVLVKLGEGFLKSKKCGYGVDACDFCKTGKNGEKLLSVEQLKQKQPELKQYLEKQYRGGLHDLSPLGFDTLLKMLQFYEEKTGARKYSVKSRWEPLEGLREYEKKVRNLAAHELMPFTRDVVTTAGGRSPDDVQKRLIQQFEQLCGKKCAWNGYDRLNECIRQLLEPKA